MRGQGTKVYKLLERAFGWSADRVEDLAFTDDQLVALEDALAEVKFFDYTGADVPEKTSEFECQCGCGQTFFAAWRTKRPIYANNTHKMRAYRARKRD